MKFWEALVASLGPLGAAAFISLVLLLILCLAMLARSLFRLRRLSISNAEETTEPDNKRRETIEKGYYLLDVGWIHNGMTYSALLGEREITTQEVNLLFKELEAKITSRATLSRLFIEIPRGNIRKSNQEMRLALHIRLGEILEDIEKIIQALPPRYREEQRGVRSFAADEHQEEIATLTKLHRDLTSQSADA